MRPPDDPNYHLIAATRNMFLDAIDRQSAETITEYLGASTAKLRVAQILVLGGAIDHVPADATAYAHRGRRMMVNVASLHDAAEDAAPHET